MARVPREMVEKAGVDVDKLLDLLIRNASAELTTYYYYTILRVNLIGLDGEGLKEITEDARIEDRNHFEALVPRIYELGGKLPKSMVDFHDVSACPPAFVPADPTNIKDMLQILVDAERCAVRGYTAICNMTFGKDHRTYDLSLPSCTRRSSMRRGSQNHRRGSERPRAPKSGENSPHVGKFIGAREEEQAGAAPGPPRFTRAELSRYNGANAALPAFCASPSGAAIRRAHWAAPAL